MKLMRLTDADGNAVLVNPMNIVKVSEAETFPVGTDIYTVATGESKYNPRIVVRESLAEVANRFEEAQA